MEREKLPIQCATFFFQNADNHLYTCIPQHLYAAPMDLCKRIFAAHNHARYVAIDNEFGTRRSSAEMRARFETHIDCGLLQEWAVFGAHTVDSIHLSMCLSAMSMIPLANDTSLANNHRAHHRVGSSSVFALPSQLEAAAHIESVRCTF